MSELTNIHGRAIRELTTPNQIPAGSNTLDNVKIPAGNMPSGYEGCEALTLGQIKENLNSGLVKELTEVSEEQLEQAKLELQNLGNQQVQNAATSAAAASNSANVAGAKATEANSKLLQIQNVANTIIQNNNGVGYEATETTLLASKPTVAKTAVKALDTKKIWLWTRTSAEGVTPVTGTWTNTGLSEYELAIQQVNTNKMYNPVKAEGVNLNTLTDPGIYLVVIPVDSTLTNNYPVAGALGVVHVSASTQSSFKLQEFITLTGLEYFRTYNGTTWQDWKLKIDVNLFESKDKSFTDLGSLTPDMNLNDLTQAGRYGLSSASTAIASLENNYPKKGVAGILEVIRSTASIILQRFTSWDTGITPITYIRLFRNATWTSWIQIGMEQINMRDQGVLAADKDLNDVREVGYYIKSSNPIVDFESLNFPTRVTGVLQVYKSASSSLIYQKYTTTTGLDFNRVWNGTTWSSWVEVLTANQVANFSKIKSVFAPEMNANDLKTENASYIVNTGSLNTETTNLPERDYGILNIYKGSMSALVIQTYITPSGKLYVRSWNNVIWSQWKAQNNLIPPGGGSESDLISFVKNTDTLEWYMPLLGSNTKRIKHTFNRGVSTASNRDSWGMGKASLFDDSSLVYDVTSTGVWECALIDSENVGDHSGGAHGDEVKFLSYFLVDGVKKDEDFTGGFQAKEVKHIQHSNIYVENQLVPMCVRKTTWTFTKEGCRSQTKIEWAPNRSIRKARIAMFPVLRKVNQDGTGAQITDTEIRSQDDLVIDTTEHGFPRRDLPITGGDSILLSSAISGFSAEIKINKIVAENPHAYVQNTVVYNKIYVNGFREDAEAFNTGPNGETWEVDATYILKAQD